MAVDDSIPTASQMFGAKRRPAKGRAEALPLLFDLNPPVVKSYAPIVVEAKVPEAPLKTILYTVRQLIAEIRGVVEGAYLSTVNVQGEISNCRPAASGHVYFTLKDGEAQLPVVMFRRQAQLLGFKLRDGLAVEARGRIAVYETRGQIQLIAETLRPRGEGALQLAYEQLKRRLAAEHLFDRKRALPPFPHCIGVVTSPHGAAIRDIVNVIRRRHARLNVLIYPAPMQGPQCAPRVAAGIRWFNRQAGTAACVDLILITRGGGSFEDLNGFNSEGLARVIHASALPVVSAIGHEIDHTISDFVADLRAPTPSAAAELITAAQHRIEERVAALERRVHRTGELHLLRARRRLERLSAEQVLLRLRDGISLRHQKVDELRFRLEAAFRAGEARRLRGQAARLAALEARLRRYDPAVRLALAERRLAAAKDRLARLRSELIARRRTRLERAQFRLQALSPLAVLNRGYAIVYLEQAGGESILRDAGEALPEQRVRARLARGSVRAIISETMVE